MRSLRAKIIWDFHDILEPALYKIKSWGFDKVALSNQKDTFLQPQTFGNAMSFSCIQVQNFCLNDPFQLMLEKSDQYCLESLGIPQILILNLRNNHTVSKKDNQHICFFSLLPCGGWERNSSNKSNKNNNRFQSLWKEVNSIVSLWGCSVST